MGGSWCLLGIVGMKESNIAGTEKEASMGFLSPSSGAAILSELSFWPGLYLNERPEEENLR